jgi:serine/threonine protein kinase
VINPTGDWSGREIAEGRYRILARIGEGNMGHVYRAHDCHLQTDVVLKFPVAADALLEGSDFLERFQREVRSLVTLSHPHIVKVIDVGEHEGRPFVVMQYLEGGSLKDRAMSGPNGTARAMSPHSLLDWLPDVAQALDFIHEQNFVHRDVKPANILFDRHGNAFLSDLGIIKALAAEDGGPPQGSSLTAPGFLLGTPNYVAPEVVMGRRIDGRADQYALAMTVHEVLTGSNCMAGPTPSATVVNQTTIVPPDLADLIPGVPFRLSDAVHRGLAKDPLDRFESCAALACEILGELGDADPAAQTALVPVVDSTMIPLPTGSDGSGMRRHHPAPGQLRGTGSTLVPEPGPGPAVTALKATDRASHAVRVGIAAAAVFVLLAGALAIALGRGGPKPATDRDPGAATPAVAAAAPVEINIAYGTEKQSWLEPATEAFQKTAAGRGIKVNLIGMGSVEGAHAVLAGPQPTPIHVWSPASSAYRDVFEREWRVKSGKNPIIKAENLALTPMVFVMWESRYRPFVGKYGKVAFRSLAEAMREPGGWGAIAGKPDWGLFKFGHTHPNKSNSGLLTLVLMAYEFSDKERGLAVSDVTRADFQEWLHAFERNVPRPSGSLTNSTGTLMREMVLRGPSQYDCLMLYENLAIDYLEAARDRWGELRVDYPEPNLWNEHPFYVLDVPWSSAEQRRAATEFLRFLMSEPVQRDALKHGFRPGNPSVPVRSSDSPLVRHEAHGIKLDLPRMGEPPTADVVNDLLAEFRRIDR